MLPSGQPRSATEEALAAEGMSKEEIITAVADEHERQKEDAEVGGLRVEFPFRCHDAVSQSQCRRNAVCSYKLDGTSFSMDIQLR